jgi:hypothetical protein
MGHWSKRQELKRLHQGGNSKYIKYSICSGRYQLNMEQNQKGINIASKKIIGKEERPQRNSFMRNVQ